MTSSTNLAQLQASVAKFNHDVNLLFEALQFITTRTPDTPEKLERMAEIVSGTRAKAKDIVILLNRIISEELK